MTPRTRIGLAVGTAALLGLLAWALAPRPLLVDLAQARVGPFEQAIQEDARTRLRERHVVTAPLAGRLQRIRLREGDAVQSGEVLAVLQPLAAPLQDARTRGELQARAEASAAAVQRAGAVVSQQQVALAQAQADLQRHEPLARQGFIAPTQLDTLRLAVQAAQQGLEAAVQARHVAEHERDMARAALAASQGSAGPDGTGSARQPAMFELRAPVAGRVMKVMQPSETTVALGTPLLEVGDTRALEVVAELLTTEALQVPPKAEVQVSHWGGPGVLRGRVRRVEPAGFTKVSALGVEEQRVNVLIDLTDPAERWAALGDGYRVSVRIQTRLEAQALQVPVSAVFPRAGAASSGMAAFAVVDGRARVVPVTLGGRNDEAAWLTQGLKAGDSVVVYPPAELADGLRVRPREPDPSR